MQNIGAYGVELKDVFDSLTALDRQDGTLREFDRQACRFGYRDSLFKQEPDRWLILRVRLRLTRRERLHLDYGPVRQRLEEEGIASPTARDVSRVICAIRRKSCPTPPYWAMPAASSRTRWWMRRRPNACVRPSRIWLAIRRRTVG